ncbi:MAG: hypothetical protein A2622_03700 [Bdellovibrionales bacterium RIFCSPHIGHO2_01_FULL_40_29]|nr:MAG: hypothetical protein A2622_03700 [Bdellovibrionales bacterium RIFCSPHIGHO2_01_FULL_40_29]OFZ35377.1 MAG: hypothetical protein A3D17_08330 [Bdellovibrionales bacterium RIFCSPHIGHO2_02_FULL_40_15]
MKILIALVLWISINANAAPHPMMATTRINQIQSGAVFSQWGFSVQKFPLDWSLKTPLASDQNALEIGPMDMTSKTLISFKAEHVSAKTDLEKYVRQYLRDYNQYGFEVVGLQSLKEQHHNSVVVDLNQKNKLTRSRQVFFKKNDRIVLATCLDSFEQFNKTILICNSILDTFSWR